MLINQWLQISVPQGAPQNFSAVGLSETAVRLAWDLPAQKLRNGEIVMYQLRYYQLTDAINEEEKNITALQYDIDNLETNTDYVFQIKAYTEKGSGPWSARLQYRTFGKRMWGLRLQFQHEGNDLQRYCLLHLRMKI